MSAWQKIKIGARWFVGISLAAIMAGEVVRRIPGAVEWVQGGRFLWLLLGVLGIIAGVLLLRRRG